jgi:rSAM/selenodomain-associated transferase 1
MMRQALLIFAKNPVMGNVKTRLAATIGNEAALSVYKELLEQTFAITNYLPVDKFVFYDSYIEAQDIWDSEHYFKQLQNGNDLGERMDNAFTSLFIMGYNSIVVIGTDCPELNAGIIMNAFAYLNKHDIVIGPAADGGYYLLGMKQNYSMLFDNIQWSTHTVFDETTERFVAAHLDYYLLPVLRDVDEEKDLRHMKNEIV